MRSNPPNRKALFDRWSAYYDLSVDEGGFPFIGYREVLYSLVEMADFRDGQRVLDLGVGTGNLSKVLPVSREAIWGADFSSRMIEKASKILEPSHLIQVDLLQADWPPAMKGPYERIVSGYTLHEFDASHKRSILVRLAEEYLAPGGAIVIGDISYKSRADFEEAHQALHGLWDEEEYYWCAEEMIPLLEAVGFRVVYVQVSACGGVYLLTTGEI